MIYFNPKDSSLLGQRKSKGAPSYVEKQKGHLRSGAYFAAKSQKENISIIFIIFEEIFTTTN